MTRKIFTAGVSNSLVFVFVFCFFVFLVKLFFYFIRILSVLFCLSPTRQKSPSLAQFRSESDVVLPSPRGSFCKIIILTRAKHGNHYIASCFLPIDYLILNLLIIIKYAITINRCVQERCLDCSAK